MQRAVAAHKKSGRHIIIHEFAPISPPDTLCLVCVSVFNKSSPKACAEFKLISIAANTSELRAQSANKKCNFYTPTANWRTLIAKNTLAVQFYIWCDSPKGIYGLQCALITPECFNWWDFLLSALPFSNPIIKNKYNIFQRTLLGCWDTWSLHWKSYVVCWEHSTNFHNILIFFLIFL